MRLCLMNIFPEMTVIYGPQSALESGEEHHIQTTFSKGRDSTPFNEKKV